VKTEMIRGSEQREFRSDFQVKPALRRWRVRATASIDGSATGSKSEVTRQVFEDEDMLEQPRDFIGNILAALISKPLGRPDFRAQVMRWKMVVVLETDYYPVTIMFDKGVKVEHGDNPQPTIRVRANLDTIIELVKGATSPIRALLTGGLKVKGVLKHPRATLRFYRLISSSIRG